MLGAIVVVRLSELAQRGAIGGLAMVRSRLKSNPRGETTVEKSSIRQVLRLRHREVESTIYIHTRYATARGVTTAMPRCRQEVLLADGKGRPLLLPAAETNQRWRRREIPPEGWRRQEIPPEGPRQTTCRRSNLTPGGGAHPRRLRYVLAQEQTSCCKRYRQHPCSCFVNTEYCTGYRV